MVRVHVKSGHDSCEFEFLYECQSDLLIDEIASEVIQIFNLQSKIHRLISEFEPLLLPFSGDPKATSLLRAFSEAKSYASKDMVIHNRPLSFLVLRHHFETIERELVAKFDILGVYDSTQYQQLSSVIQITFQLSKHLDYPHVFKIIGIFPLSRCQSASKLFTCLPSFLPFPLTESITISHELLCSILIYP
ncbi:uncharacterized protein LOC101218784 isoform X1 [Cucumis sativus]|uniref:uncharacterized protein LOC101218784 isoform X1 n=1 Tax=Cucumis sativus TaxID=3659 RepID=UPI0012F5195F|nr:uncharacterized protein LOC101218784 isoform X1 [Cucumis sativus]